MQQSLIAATLTLSNYTFPIVSGNMVCINVTGHVEIEVYKLSD